MAVIACTCTEQMLVAVEIEYSSPLRVENAFPSLKVKSEQRLKRSKSV
jgi:hypothetical protein